MVSEERVIMPVKELRLVQVIRQMMDKKLTQVKAGSVLGLTPRHIRRLIDWVEQEGDHADHAPGSVARRSRAQGSAREDRGGHTGPPTPAPGHAEPGSSVAPTPAVGATNTGDGGENITRTFLLWEKEAMSNRLRKHSVNVQNAERIFPMASMSTSPQDAQKGRPARPQRAKRRGVRFGTLSL